MPTLLTGYVPILQALACLSFCILAACAEPSSNATTDDSSSDADAHSIFHTRSNTTGVGIQWELDQIATLGKVQCTHNTTVTKDESATNVGDLNVTCGDATFADLAWEVTATDNAFHLQARTAATPLGSVACDLASNPTATATLSLQIKLFATLEQSSVTLRATLETQTLPSESTETATAPPTCTISVDGVDAKLQEGEATLLTLVADPSPRRQVSVNCFEVVKRTCGGVAGGSPVGLSDIRIELLGQL